eukprot:scaffold39040_cov21-Tisochrysis_lutea.AAC.1
MVEIAREYAAATYKRGCVETKGCASAGRVLSTGQEQGTTEQVHISKWDEKARNCAVATREEEHFKSKALTEFGGCAWQAGTQRQSKLTPR